jgi:hypothetical protein
MWQFSQTGNNQQGGGFPDASAQQQLALAGMNMQALGNYPSNLLNSLQNNSSMADQLQQATGVNHFMPSFGQGLVGAAAQQQQSQLNAASSAATPSAQGQQLGLTGSSKPGDIGQGVDANSNLNQQNKNYQLAAMAAAANPQLLQYLQACQPGLFGNAGIVGGVGVGNDQLGNMNITPQQALLLAKQQQQINSQRSLIGGDNTQDVQNQNEQQSTPNPLALAATQAGLLNPGFGSYNTGQSQGSLGGNLGGSFTNRGGGQGLDPALGGMSPNLLAMLGASNNGLNMSQRSMLGAAAGLNNGDSQRSFFGTDTWTNVETSEKAAINEASRETSNTTPIPRAPTIIPNPSAMDVPNQNIAALLAEENKKHGKDSDKNPGYVSGPSKSKVGTTPQTLPPLLRGKFVTKAPNCHDILCGRGNFVNNHVGNKNFREIVAMHKVLYVAAPKHSKPMFARKIIDAVHGLEPPGRFLAQEPSTKLWYELDNKKSMSKTRQALREGAPQIMKTIQVDESHDGVDDASDNGNSRQSPRKGAQESSDDDRYD